MTAPDWLPDWRDPEAYPEANAMSLKQWAWQFLRRNPDYQADFHELEGRLPKVLVPESTEEYFWITSENEHEFDEAYWRDYHLTHIEDEGGGSLSQRLGEKYQYRRPADRPPTTCSNAASCSLYVPFLTLQCCKEPEGRDGDSNQFPKRAPTKRAPYSGSLLSLDHVSLRGNPPIS